MNKDENKEELRRKWKEISEDRFNYLLSLEAFNSVGEEYQIGVYPIKDIIEIWNKNRDRKVSLEQLKRDMINEDMELFDETIDQFLKYCEERGTVFDIWGFEQWLRERILEGFPVAHQVNWNSKTKIIEVAFFTAIGGPTYYYLYVAPIIAEVVDEKIKIIFGDTYFDFSEWLNDYVEHKRCDGAWELTTYMGEIECIISVILEHEKTKILEEIAKDLTSSLVFF